MRAFIASFGYAARGVGRAVQAERNFRFELCAAIYVLLACPFFGFAPAEWALVFLCIGGVLEYLHYKQVQKREGGKQAAPAGENHADRNAGPGTAGSQSRGI